MNSSTKNFIIGIFILHIASIIGLILTFYFMNIETKVLHILIYYLASFLTIYFITVLCYLMTDIQQPNSAFQI